MATPLLKQRPCIRHGSASGVALGGNVGGAVVPEKELREQLHQEIENKSKSCSNPTYECSIPRIDGYEYCIRHILRDPRGNYRQCTYTYPNSRKCPNAVPKHDIKKDPALTTLCFEHSRQTQLHKTHTTVGKLRRTDTNEALLHNLAHHVNIEDSLPERSGGGGAGGGGLCSGNEQDEEIDVVSPHVAPFVSHDQIHGLSTIVNTIRKRRRILDYASDSSSNNDEPPCMNNTARGQEFNESDNESVDSQDEDLLKHAGIYTRQEAIRISEAKLTKLQGLYIDQINRLHHTLKERRRRYLQSIRKEREILCSIHDQVKETPRERALYDKLKALNTYHRRHGVEAVLYKKFKEKRSRATDGYGGHKGPGFTKCIFTEGGVKCGERAMPCCKFCRKHILEDKKQILFRACEVEKSGVVCQEPMPCIFDDASTCVLHLAMPEQRQYIQKKYESETEDEEATTTPLELKQEIIESNTTTAAKNLEEQQASTQQQKHEENSTTASSPTAELDASENVTISHDQPSPLKPDAEVVVDVGGAEEQQQQLNNITVQ